MSYFDAVKAGFLDELAKIAEEGTRKQPQKLTGGAKALAFLAGGPGALFGAEKAAPHGEALEGGLRGATGVGLGSLGGGLVGQHLGGLAAQALERAGVGAGAPLQAIGSIGGALAGNVAGGVGGYKLLTRKYNQPPAGMAE